MMNQPLIELKNIVRRYGHGDTETTVLKSINLKIYAGEMVAIVGLRDRKSTLMNILGVLDQADDGEYLFEVVRSAHYPLMNWRIYAVTTLALFSSVIIYCLISLQ